MIEIESIFSKTMVQQLRPLVSEGGQGDKGCGENAEKKCLTVHLRDLAHGSLPPHIRNMLPRRRHLIGATFSIANRRTTCATAGGTAARYDGGDQQKRVRRKS